METESITCNHCGAPLQIPRGANFVTCTHCGSNLAVRRTPSVVFTETIEKLSATTEQLADQLARLERNQRLDSLERHWQSQQNSFMVSDSKGRQHLPNETTAVIGGVIAVAFGCVWTGIAFSIAPFMAIFGLLFIALGVATAIFQVKKAREFSAAQSRYRRERSNLLRPGMDAPNPQSTQVHEES